MQNSVCRYLDATDLMQELLGEVPDTDFISVFAGDPPDRVLRELLIDADVVLNGHTVLGPELLGSAPRLKSIIYLGTGAGSYIDLKAAGERNIKVQTIAGYGNRAVAEHAFALVLAAARQIVLMDAGIRSGSWQVREGVELRGKVLGVIGLGGIGRELAGIAAGFGMKVLAWNRTPLAEPPACTQVPIAELLKQSDVISMHLALTSETEGFLDAARLRVMKSSAILVNTARGRLVDTAALIEALKSGRIAHAALDVFDDEPLTPEDQLIALANVTLTAHAAYKSREASRNLIRRAVELARNDIAAL